MSMKQKKKKKKRRIVLEQPLKSASEFGKFKLELYLIYNIYKDIVSTYINNVRNKTIMLVKKNSRLSNEKEWNEMNEMKWNEMKKNSRLSFWIDASEKFLNMKTFYKLNFCLTKIIFSYTSTHLFTFNWTIILDRKCLQNLKLTNNI